MKKIIFAALCSLAFSFLYAQELPWSRLPQKKKIENTDLEEISVFLVTDTIRQTNTDENAKHTINFFYNSGVDLVGHGYKDSAGNPFGVWKYYTAKNNKYQLYCEGYYGKLKAENLVVEQDIINKFPSSNTVEAKENFINSISDKFFFTGEWRFYKEGRLEKIIRLDDKVRLPYFMSVNLASQNNSTKPEEMGDLLSYLLPANRLSGNLAMVVHFSGNGFIESIYSENIRWEFDSNGKPVIAPLQDLEIPRGR